MSLVCILLYANLRSPPEDDHAQEPVYFNRTTEPSTITPEQTDEPASEQDEQELESETNSEPEPYESPVDFEALWTINTDVYAWLDIPGTEISYPILQSTEADDYYLRRNIERESDSNGVIWTEGSYNGTDFTDPLTVIYGHNMNNGKMFGTLQSVYSSQEALEEHSEIVIYLPDMELHFTVFAAVPYDNRHILYNYDFTNKRTFRLFFQEILSVRAIQAVYAEDAAVSSNERTIILSTCLNGNRSNRFLVCGKLAEMIPTDENK